MNILITGISSGLGKTLSLELLRKNNLVWGVSRKDENHPALKQLFENKNFIYSQCDVGIERNVSQLINEIKEANFDIDIVILNAGLMENDIGINGFDYYSFKKIMDVNFLGSMVIIKGILPIFLNQGNGLFIGISSLAAHRGVVVNKIAYPASKAALNMAFESFRLQLSNKNIRFLTVNLGPLSEKKGLLRASYRQAARKIISLIDKRVNLVNYPFLPTLIFRIFKFIPDSILSKYVIKPGSSPN